MPPASREKQLSAWLLTIAGNVFVEDDTRGGRRYVARRSYQLSRAATQRSGRLAAQGNAQPLSLVAAFRQRVCAIYMRGTGADFGEGSFASRGSGNRRCAPKPL